DPPSPGQMKERPRYLDASLLDTRDWWGIAYVGAVMGVAALFFYNRAPSTTAADLAPARALAFTLLALSPLVHAFSCRSASESLLTLRPVISVPLLIAVAMSASIHLVSLVIEPLRPVFKTFPLSSEDILLCTGLSLLIIPAMELWKLLPRNTPRPT
ncbi:MAG: cation-translocating P-type ATPase C-terminal domain-containing protein, partial [Myxococcales bacterium]|nr:cation-translocating P-type ATPase C-terminal domain-containing protein [Polyangiaceae bacterium]MDW8248578.1 cation-translocating P-type ATPase C-terminal domain-containing protein [Myxococcales bacterium]